MLTFDASLFSFEIAGFIIPYLPFTTKMTIILKHCIYWGYVRWFVFKIFCTVIIVVSSLKQDIPSFQKYFSTTVVFYKNICGGTPVCGYRIQTIDDFSKQNKTKHPCSFQIAISGVIILYRHLVGYLLVLFQELVSEHYKFKVFFSSLY